MDRKQKEQRVQQQDGKVFDVADLTINVRYQSQDYICQRGNGSLTPTGHLIVFKLTPVSSKPPSFVARWDGGSREPGKQERFDLDIDMVGMSKDEVEKFERGQAGYSGHHTTKIHAPTGHGYEILVKTPNGEVFDATVSFTLHRRQAVSISSSATVNLDAEKS
jgi:hypothetical protein